MTLQGNDKHVLDNVVLSLLTVIAYFLVIFPMTRGAAPYMFLLTLVLLGSLPVLIRDFRTKSFSLLLVMLISALLLWFGTSGQFFSSFFFVLYLASITLVLFLSPSLSFAVALVTIAGLLSQMSSGLDSVSILTMFLLIPFAYFLSRTYIWLQERDKKILVLEEKLCAHFDNPVDELLNNQLTRFFAEVREPLSDIKQMAYYVPYMDSKEEVEKSRSRIISASEHALGMIKDFEEETTGRKLLENPERLGFRG